MNKSIGRIVVSFLIAMLIAAGCGSSDDSPGSAESDSTTASDSATGIRLVSARDGAAIMENPPADLVILDVRTAEEFTEGHIDGAIMIDFYRDDFADQIADLDPDVPYLLYCRSGNRSGQTADIMANLGFTNVADVDGGIVSWTQASLPTVTG